MANIDDKEWLGLLAGKVLISKDETQTRAVSALRSSIKKFDAEELAQSEGLKKLKLRMAGEGLFVEPSENSFFKKLIKFLKKVRLIIIFIMGMIAGLMVPLQLATRGGADISIIDKFSLNRVNETINNELIIIDPNPLTKSQEIISSAVAAGLIVTINGSDEDMHLLIKGFKKMDPNFTAVNSILGISNQTQGNVSVILKTK